jgi:hypothetical protein
MAPQGADGDPLRAELERLYALPPAGFTAARDELAGRLRREGARDAAAEVKALPRPTPSSWAINRLMRLDPGRWQALLAAGREAHRAQGQVVGGQGAAASAPAARLREALQEARRLVEELRRHGLELLAAAGRPATAQIAERLAANLQALAFTPGAEAAIARGWLDHDLEAPGFEVLAGLQAAAGRDAAPPPQASRASPLPSRPVLARQPPPDRPGAGRGDTAQRGASRSRAAGSGAGAAPKPRGESRAERAPARPARSGAADGRGAPASAVAAQEAPAGAARQAPDRGRASRQRLAEERQAGRQADRQAQAARRLASVERARREREARQQERVAEAEAAAERATRELAELRSAAAAAEAHAAGLRRQAEAAGLEAERARRRADQARFTLERARQRLAAVRAGGGRENA